MLGTGAQWRPMTVGRKIPIGATAGTRARTNVCRAPKFDMFELSCV